MWTSNSERSVTERSCCPSTTRVNMSEDHSQQLMSDTNSHCSEHLIDTVQCLVHQRGELEIDLALTVQLSRNWCDVLQLC